VEWLNYHHLHYFWVVAKEGSVAAASRRLRVSHPTISAQLKLLEEALDAPLFERRGRGLVLTDTGRDVLEYADAIFALGRELLQTVKGGAGTGAGALRLRVGVVDVLPKTVVHRLLAPALSLDRPVRLLVREEPSLEVLLGQLASHEHDLVLSDRTASPELPARLYSHPLGASRTVLVAAPSVAASLRGPFPGCLDGAPFVLPTHASAMRQRLDSWLQAHGLQPRVTAELDDSALAEVFAEQGAGVCAVPEVVLVEVLRRYDLVEIGRLPLSQSFFIVSAERRLVHPAVVAVRDAARAELSAIS
jgi:LysR family transcriptional activator of nhaA